MSKQTVLNAQQDFAKINTTSRNGILPSTMILVIVVEQGDVDTALNSEKYTCHPLICNRRGNGDAVSMNFVDEGGNIYHNWECYKQENNLKDGIMVAPRNGNYTFNEDGQVQLELCETPARIAVTMSPKVREAQQGFANNSKYIGVENSSNIIYVLVTNKTDLCNAESSRDFTQHPLIKSKYITSENEASIRFIDENSEIYPSWDCYLSNNKLPEGIMIAPLKGTYSFDKNGDVELEVCLTPASIVQNQTVITIRSLQQDFANKYKYIKSVTPIIHVLVTTQANEDVLDATEFEDFCVLRTQHEADDSEIEFVYEDDRGNKYSNWSTYLQNNALPDGIMVAPHNGDYTFDNSGAVELDVIVTPARLRKMRTILEVQQDFANNSSFDGEIIWDLLSAEQGDILLNKIQNLIPYQMTGQRRIDEMRATLYENVWNQRKYTNRNSLSTIIYVLVSSCQDLECALVSREFSCHPVFRTRKCITDGDSSSCCMIFIDELGRVYQNWKTYLSNNDLPPGTMIAPRNGIYTTDDTGVVQLEMCTTPNGSVARMALDIADKSTALVGFVGAAVPIAALMTTLAPPIIIGATVFCTTTAVYSTIRSACNLIDRRNHEQSIGLGNTQARNSWIGIGAGIIGMGASSATKALTTAAATGQEISTVAKLVVNGMNISSIVLSGTGVANGVLDLVLKYRDDENVSSMDCVQLAASLILFTHSVTNFRLASKLISETNHRTIHDYRKSLSNRQRKMFDKMSKETIRIRGEARGKIDIIRNVNEIPSKQYLNDLYKINSQLNEAKIRPSFGTAGEGVVLNNEVRVDTKVLRNHVQHKNSPNLLQSITQPIPGSYNEADVNSAGTLLSNSNIQVPKAKAYSVGVSSILLPNSALISFSEFGTRLMDIIVNAESFEGVVITMANLYGEEAFRLLMKLAQRFVEERLDRLKTVLRIYISAESIIYQILTHCMKRYSNRAHEFLHMRSDEILQTLTDYFYSLNPNTHQDLQIKCKICGGFYSVCEF